MKIIAELCQNHNGNSKILAKMVAAASQSGATHVKIQHIYSKNLSKRFVFEKGLKLDNRVIFIKRPYNYEYQRLKKLELSKNQIKDFIKLCKDYSVIPLTTCFTRKDIPEIRDLGFKEIKVASYDCSSYPMLRELKNNFNHIYLSTGASYDIEIKTAAKILGRKFSLLHCVTQYPTNLKNLNLSRLNYLKRFSKEIGYSDHTNPVRDKLVSSMAAIFFGSKVLERHFTILDKTLTKDGVVSVNPDELKEITKFSKLNKKDQLKTLSKKKFKRKLILGRTNPKMSNEELNNRDYYKGRFVSRIHDNRGELVINNWEETPLSYTDK